ncbi:MAG: hypothetical protein MJK04_09160 [Psychrosphaera sp.]|nr:hypothetical protein [Psychrosphaera sp.]
MKSPSEQQPDKLANVEQAVNAALDQSVHNLSDKAVGDIYQARHAALNALHSRNAGQSRQAKKGIGAQLMQMVMQMAMQPFPRVAFPVAAAMLLAITLNYETSDPVPALPLALMTEDVPTEDLALLEDLEFVTLMAQNEQDVLL